MAPLVLKPRRLMNMIRQTLSAGGVFFVKIEASTLWRLAEGDSSWFIAIAISYTGFFSKGDCTFEVVM